MAELFIELLSEEMPARLQIDARKKITININEPTTPKIFERFVKTKAPIKPPDED